MKKAQKNKNSLVEAYKLAKGFGTMGPEDKKKRQISKFRQVLGKGK